MLQSINEYVSRQIDNLLNTHAVLFNPIFSIKLNCSAKVSFLTLAALYSTAVSLSIYLTISLCSIANIRTVNLVKRPQQAALQLQLMKRTLFHLSRSSLSLFL